ncbi:hypothetical protein BD311DRAFT_246381 [Dichomitus squalens]|uniref:Uncharacterized protein n=1 Tax=Dichomitus squalens TaxID=114155 RepID=A0A4Q9MQD9_9APHY|nr:hypothetical protein BD311DRAFT_246381 [Dichomitus squalens]
MQSHQFLLQCPGDPVSRTPAATELRRSLRQFLALYGLARGRGYSAAAHDASRSLRWEYSNWGAMTGLTRASPDLTTLPIKFVDASIGLLTRSLVRPPRRSWNLAVNLRRLTLRYCGSCSDSCPPPPIVYAIDIAPLFKLGSEPFAVAKSSCRTNLSATCPTRG